MPYVKPVLSSGHALICMVGLPRSGKSTWARSTGLPVVNRDAIRLALHGERFLKPAEGLVKELALLQVKSLFLAGHKIVIVDETNTTRARRDFWNTGPWTTYFRIMFTPMETLLERAKDDPAIIPVIERMDIQYEQLGPDERMLSEDSSLNKWVEAIRIKWVEAMRIRTDD